MSRLRQSHPHESVDGLCGLFGYTRQTYHYHLNKASERKLQEDVVLSLVHDIRSRHPRIGTRKLKIMLERDHGVDVGRDRLFEMLDRNGLLCLSVTTVSMWDVTGCSRCSTATVCSFGAASAIGGRPSRGMA